MAKKQEKESTYVPKKTQAGMQKCSATIRLGGSLLHTVRKHKISPAEVVVLRAVHGDDAVAEMELDRAEPTRRAEELEMLVTTYGEEVVAKCFPGHAPSIPTRFAEIGVNINEETRKTKLLKQAREIDTEMHEDDEDDELEPSYDEQMEELGL